jgi:hypothetical protein
MGRARGANAVLHAAFETTYGLPPASGYRKLPFVSSALGAERGLIESDLLGGGRRAFDPTPDVVNNDGDVVVPADTKALGVWLKALFGQPDSSPAAEEGQVEHEFTSDTGTLPSMSIEIGHPDVPAYLVNYGIRANTLRMEMSRGGLLNASIGLIGKGTTVPVTSSGIVPTDLGEITRFPQAVGEIVSLGGVTLGTIMRASFSYSNNLEKIEAIRPDGEITDADPGMPMASGQLTATFADNVLYNKAVAGEPVSIIHRWSLPLGALAVLFPRVFLPRPKRPITGPGGVQADFPWQASGQTDPLCNVILRNTLASY